MPGTPRKETPKEATPPSKPGWNGRRDADTGLPGQADQGTSVPAAEGLGGPLDALPRKRRGPDAPEGDNEPREKPTSGGVFLPA